MGDREVLSASAGSQPTAPNPMGSRPPPNLNSSHPQGPLASAQTAPPLSRAPAHSGWQPQENPGPLQANSRPSASQPPPGGPESSARGSEPVTAGPPAWRPKFAELMEGSDSEGSEAGEWGSAAPAPAAAAAPAPAVGVVYDDEATWESASVMSAAPPAAQGRGPTEGGGRLAGPAVSSQTWEFSTLGTTGFQSGVVKMGVNLFMGKGRSWESTQAGSRGAGSQVQGNVSGPSLTGLCLQCHLESVKAAGMHPGYIFRSKVSMQMKLATA